VTKPATTPDTLRVKKLEIVDAAGKTSIVLNSDPKNGPGLVMYDGKGQVRVRLTAQPVWEPLSIYDPQPHTNVPYRYDPDLVLYDDSGTLRALLTVIFGVSLLQLRDKDGKVIWQAPPK